MFNPHNYGYGTSEGDAEKEALAELDANKKQTCSWCGGKGTCECAAPKPLVR